MSHAVASYQLQMALNGFFVRGGFTVGQTYMNTNLVFGDAILEAHLIESKIAVYPRIVLSTKLKQIVQHHLDAYMPVWASPQQRFLLCDANDNLFINYLGMVVQGDMEEPHVDWDLLLQHKLRVEENLTRFQGSTKIYRKYRWLAGYHNYYFRRPIRQIQTGSGRSSTTSHDRITSQILPSLAAVFDLAS